jgi:hypothetical protein
MPISEFQLETWSKQSSTQNFTNTYNTIKSILEENKAPFSWRDFNIFLQGSYRNSTNVYKDSDVDVIIKLNKINYIDINSLSDDDKLRWQRSRLVPEKSLDVFKKEVISWLYSKFGSDFTVGKKPIKIKGSGNRKDADVLVCAIARRYFRYKSDSDQIYSDGILFRDLYGNNIINYPEQHIANCSERHQQSQMRFKSTVRIYKNIRNALISKEIIKSDLAPSYFIEGLLYNVPLIQFGGSEQNNLANTLKWLNSNDKSNFICANEHYVLFNDSSPVTWRLKNCELFLSAIIKFWNDYR